MPTITCQTITQPRITCQRDWCHSARRFPTSHTDQVPDLNQATFERPNQLDDWVGASLSQIERRHEALAVRRSDIGDVHVAPASDASERAILANIGDVIECAAGNGDVSRRRSTRLTMEET